VSFKDFGAASAEYYDDPVEFAIDGDRFSISRRVPAMVLYEHVAVHTVNEAGSAFVQVVFLHAVVDEADLKRLDEALRRTRMSSKELGGVVSWILEEITGRPTRGSAPSDDASSPDGTTSRPGSRSADSTPARRRRA
jgi:hypothetical protein